MKSIIRKILKEEFQNDMRRFDKRKNIMEANLALERSFLKNKGLLVETFDPNILTEEETIDVKKVTDVIKKHGGDPNDEEIAKNFFDELLDSDFDPSKIKVDDVIESKKKEDDLVLEAGSYASSIASAMNKLQGYLAKPEKAGVIIGFLSKFLGKKWGKASVEKLSKGLKWLGGVMDIIPDQMSKFIYKGFRKFGSSLETASAASIGGDILWLALLIYIGVIMFPALSSFVAGGLGIWKIIMALPKFWSILKNIGSLISKGMGIYKEVKDKIYTPIDFLTDFEELTNGEISYKLKSGFEGWYNGMVKNPEKWSKQAKVLKSVLGFISNDVVKLVSTVIDVSAEASKKYSKKEFRKKVKLAIGKLFGESLSLIKNGRETKAGEILKKLGLPEDILKEMSNMIHNNPSKSKDNKK
jgi:hypothetical protein